MTSPTQTDADRLALLQQRLRDNLAQAGRDLLELTLLARQMSGAAVETEPVRQIVTAVVCDRFALTELELMQRVQQPRIAHPRQLAIALFSELRPQVSRREVGKLFGGLHHVTVLSSIQTVKDRCDAYPAEAAIRDELRAKIRERMEGKG